MPSSTPDLHNPSAATHFYDDRFAQGYMGEWPAEKRLRVEALIRELNLPSTGCALDFGCGAGVFTEILGRALPGWSVEGTDLSATAVAQAAARFPSMRFFPLAECDTIEARYDFVFTHHVLEHVSDIRSTAALLARMAKPRATMFHILPCGDAGSLAHRVCTMRVDGIDPAREFRFFFEEEGHLRRLDTERLVSLWTTAGFRKQRAWYANHWMATVAWLSSGNREEVGRFADPSAAVDSAARRRLLSMRLTFSALWALRKPVTIVGHKRRFGCHGLRDYILLGTALLCWPIAYPVDRFVRFLTEREWQRRKDEPGGAEMYVAISRSTT